MNGVRRRNWIKSTKSTKATSDTISASIANNLGSPKHDVRCAGTELVSSVQERLGSRFDVVVLPLVVYEHLHSNSIILFAEQHSRSQIGDVALKKVLQVGCNPRDHGWHFSLNAVVARYKKAVQMVYIPVDVNIRAVAALEVSTGLAGGRTVL